MAVSLFEPKLTGSLLFRLESLGSKPREKETRDREGSRSQSPSGGESDGDDDLENMRRSLLAQRSRFTSVRIKGPDQAGLQSSLKFPIRNPPEFESILVLSVTEGNR